MDALALLGGTPVRNSVLPYARQTIEADDLDAVAAALRGDWITQGPTIARFERALAGAAGVAQAVAFSSGTSALQAAYAAARLGPGDEVITTPLTFAATTNAIVSRGAEPVFADIDAATLDLDPDAVKRSATARTRAIVPVDFAGLPCDYARLVALAREHGWTVIADAAHSFGGALDDRPVGALADMTTLSFHPAKLITTGEGGAVLTDRPDLAERLRSVRHHGIRYGDASRPWRYEIDEPGSNYRITDFQAALGLTQLAKRERFLAARARLADRYRGRLKASPLATLPELPAGRRHAWHLFVVLLRLEALTADRDTIVQALRAEGIGATVHYPLVSRHAFYRRAAGATGTACPVAEDIEGRLVTLPLFPAMTEADQDDVLEALDKVLGHFAR
jgi:perosamine synthetase